MWRDLAATTISGKPIVRVWLRVCAVGGRDPHVQRSTRARGLGPKNGQRKKRRLVAVACCGACAFPGTLRCFGPGNRPSGVWCRRGAGRACAAAVPCQGRQQAGRTGPARCGGHASKHRVGGGTYIRWHVCKHAHARERMCAAAHYDGVTRCNALSLKVSLTGAGLQHARQVQGADGSDASPIVVSLELGHDVGIGTKRYMCAPGVRVWWLLVVSFLSCKSLVRRSV
jgi:hypothetical protein